MSSGGVLRDKSIIITGASSGLGAALAYGFAAEGAHLALLARSAGRLEEVAKRCQELGGRALAVPGDVTRPEDCARLLEAVVSEFGAVDYLVANAGVSMWARFDEVEDLEVFRHLMEVNYLGVVNCVHYALPHLKQSSGMIVAVSSIQGKISVPMHTGYCASKHALQGFCDALRMELEGSGVDVLTVLLHWLRGTELRQNALGGDGKARGEGSRKHSSESVSIEEASGAIMNAMGKRQRELVIPWKLKMLLGLQAILPQAAESLISCAVRKQDG